MKKIFLLKITLVSVLLFFGITSCSDPDSFVPVGANDGPLPKNVRVYHLNPRTGAEYTKEELADLDYNPFEKEVYLIDQPVVIMTRGSSEPVKVEVLNDGAVIATITEFTPITTEAFGEEFESAEFSTTVVDLGIDEGRTKLLEIKSSYDVGGGFAVSSQFYGVKYQGDISQINSGFQLVGKDPANTRFLGVDPNEDRDAESFESGRLGFSYNGTSQYSTIADDGYLDFRYDSNFSIGFWVRTTSDDSDPEMIADQDWGSSGNKGITIAFRGDNWRAVASDGNEKVSMDYDTNTLNDGTWHYLAVTYDRGGDMVMYEDGLAVANESMADIVGAIKSGYPIRIAQDGTGNYGQFFEGDIADAKIFDYALSPEEVSDLAEEPTFPLLLSKKSGASTALNVTLEGGAEVTTFANGLKGYTFDGVSQYGTIEDVEGLLDFRYNSNFTISFWVNTTSDSSDPEMIADQDWDSSGNKGITNAFRGDNWRAVAADGSEKVDMDYDTTTLNNGAWHLLAVTYDRGGDMTMYQDGVAVASESMAGVVGSIESGNPLRFAQDGTGSYGDFFKGSIAGTVIFDYALTAEEIADLYMH